MYIQSNSKWRSEKKKRKKRKRRRKVNHYLLHQQQQPHDTSYNFFFSLFLEFKRKQMFSPSYSKRLSPVPFPLLRFFILLYYSGFHLNRRNCKYTKTTKNQSTPARDTSGHIVCTPGMFNLTLIKINFKRIGIFGVSRLLNTIERVGTASEWVNTHQNNEKPKQKQKSRVCIMSCAVLFSQRYACKRFLNAKLESKYTMW